jgi:hypothetical protein
MSTKPQSVYIGSQLASDYFQSHNTDCDVCKSADAPETDASVIFHYVCIVVVMESGIYPTCRTALFIRVSAPPPSRPRPANEKNCTSRSCSPKGASAPPPSRTPMRADVRRLLDGVQRDEIRMLERRQHLGRVDEEMERALEWFGRW